MELLGGLPLDRLGSLTILSLVALSVITDKLVWHTRLRKAEDRADRWEAVALTAMRAGAEAGIKAAEVTAEVVSAIPDPAREKG